MNASTITECVAVPPGSTTVVVSAATLAIAQGVGASLIGCWVTVALYGMASAQTYNYFSEYHQDPLGLKAFVTLLWSIGTAHAAFTCHVVYYYTVTSAFNPEMLGHNVWSGCGSITCHIVIVLLVFAYFIRLSVQLSGTKVHFTFAIGLAIPAIGFAVSGLGSVARMAGVKSRANVRVAAEPWTTAMAVTQVAVDILLSTVVCVLLNKQKSAFKRTSVVIKVLLLFAIGRGIMTAIGETVILLAVTIDPVAGWPNSAGHVVAGLYINSLLVTLNARKSLRKAHGYAVDRSDIVTLPLSHGGLARTGNRQSVIPDDAMSKLEGEGSIEKSTASFPEANNHTSIIDISFDKERNAHESGSDAC